MGKFNFGVVKESLAALEADCRKLKEAIEKLRRQREGLLTLPLSREDVISAISEWVDAQADAFPQQLNETMNRRMGDPWRPDVGELGGDPFTLLVNDHAGRTVSPTSICYLARDVLKTAITDSIMARTDWPSEVGPPRAERQAMIVTVEVEIDRLERRAREVQDQAASLGITL